MQILGERIKPLPSAEQEEAIPIAWLEEQAKWFESMDNAFAKIEANNIRVMIKKWMSEKGERSDYNYCPNCDADMRRSYEADMRGEEED